MISRLDLRGKRGRPDVDPRDVLPRAELDVDAVVESVAPICADVRRRGAAAVAELTERFDGVRLTSTRVPAEALDAALAALDPDVRSALEEAARRARAVHEAQRREDVTIEVVPGGRVTERWLPVGRVGLYVPGGLVAYPSSVVMNVVPAQVAGVASLAVASPPQAEHGGQPHPAVLAACALLGVDEVHAVGGAQAVAMFAYGTDECRRVDLVSGPGNVYVAAAKRLVRGVVGIDSEAGPTEVAILADDTADPTAVAADLVAQAEHDALAACLLVTCSPELLDAVDAELARQVPATRHRERVQQALEGQSAAVLVDDLGHGLEVVDAWAPEHLEIATRDARSWADRVRNAGAVFVGPWSPVSLGDYLAGSNHVLPTGGTARHSGGLSVQSFLRGVHVVEYSHAALADSAAHIDALGGAEDLAAHVDAVRVRVPEVTDDAAAVIEAMLRPDLRGREPYGAPQLDVPVRLNTNENPHPPSTSLVSDLAARVADAARGMNRYPDRDASALRADLAAYLERTTGARLATEQVWAANGSNEILQQLLQAFGGPGRTALAFEPTYTMHRLICSGTGTGYLPVDRGPGFRLDADAAARAVTDHRPDIVFLCSPNNPTGTAIDDGVIEQVYAASSGMVVVDEAYAEFSAHPSAVRLLPGRERLVVTRTMSKAFAFAAARLGYFAADPAVVRAVQVVRLPYHLSVLSQAAARAALDHADELLATVDDVRRQRDRLVDEIGRVGCSVVESDANFVLFGEFADQRATWARLLEHGVLVRDVGIPGWLRVTAGTEAETTAFLEALAAAEGLGAMAEGEAIR